MGVCFRVVSDDRMFLFSLVKWGVLRKIMSKIFKANPYKFTPSYELAIYDKTEGKVRFGHPYFCFHFANKEIADMRMEMIKRLFEEGIQGVVKVCELVPTFDPEKEGMYEGPSEFLNWEISRGKTNERSWLDRLSS